MRVIDKHMNKKSSLLIIEDDVDICDILNIQLSKHDFDVSMAHDGKKGCAMALQIMPHLIILDLMLPLVDGLQVCKFIKRN